MRYQVFLFVFNFGFIFNTSHKNHTNKSDDQCQHKRSLSTQVKHESLINLFFKKFNKVRLPRKMPQQKETSPSKPNFPVLQILALEIHAFAFWYVPKLPIRFN